MSKQTKVSCNPQAIDLKELLEGPPTEFNDGNQKDVPSVTARLLVDSRCHLGECVLYDDKENAILFTSILDRTFHRLSLNNIDTTVNNTTLETFHLPKMLCAFALLETETNTNTNNNNVYLVAWEDGFQFYDLSENQPMSPMSVGEDVNPLGLPDRLNDGRVDPTGKRFICGGCAGNVKEDKSPVTVKVYSCHYDKTNHHLYHTPIVESMRVTNSICWSLDGTTMYLADSPTLQIHQYDYNCHHNQDEEEKEKEGFVKNTKETQPGKKKGLISNKRHFHDKSVGFADGSVVDAAGYVWNATWRQGAGTGMVQRIDPNSGTVVFTVHLPDTTSEASCCCFGGPNLDILFITTAWENLNPSTEIHAGGLYAVKLPPEMRGNKEQRFIIPDGAI